MISLDAMHRISHYYWLCFAVRQSTEAYYCSLPLKKKYLAENTSEVSEQWTSENRASDSSNPHDVPSVVSTHQTNSSDLLFGRIFGTAMRSSNEAKRNKIIGSSLSVIFSDQFQILFFF